jgi:hypothetical protein
MCGGKYTLQPVKTYISPGQKADLKKRSETAHYVLPWQTRGFALFSVARGEH